MESRSLAPRNLGKDAQGQRREGCTAITGQRSKPTLLHSTPALPFIPWVVLSLCNEVSPSVHPLIPYHFCEHSVPRAPSPWETAALPAF